MKLAASFSVPLPVADAWTLLQDIERAATWFPGARLESVEGESFKGTVRVKVGPMMVDYRGTARFVERDEAAYRVVIEASGREQRGSGTAKARAVTALTAAGERTDVSVSIDLDVTGRPAQLGQSLMQDIAQRLVGEFSDRMEADLSAHTTTDEQPAAGGDGAAAHASAAGGPVGPGEARGAAAGAREDDVLDLGRIAGPAVLRKVAPVLLAVVVAALLRRWFTSRRAAPLTRRCP